MEGEKSVADRAGIPPPPAFHAYAPAGTKSVMCATAYVGSQDAAEWDFVKENLSCKGQMQAGRRGRGGGLVGVGQMSKVLNWDKKEGGGGASPGSNAADHSEKGLSTGVCRYVCSMRKFFPLPAAVYCASVG